jgi:hypothetical protein
MNELLRQEIIPTVMVKLGDKEYPLNFPMGVVLLYKQRTGDNLCQTDTWHKIAPAEDPDRFLACLWAGLHRYDPASKKFVEVLSYDDLGALIQIWEAAEITVALAKALTLHFPTEKKEPDPNGQAPEKAPARKLKRADPAA